MTALLYVGVDVSKASFHAAYQSPTQRWQQTVFFNTPAGFAAFQTWLPASCQVVMEATGAYHLPLATFLYGQHCPLSVINPLFSRRFAQLRGERTKTDAVDARVLAELGTQRQPPLWQPSPLVYSQMQQLQTLLGQYLKQRTALKNQQEAFGASGVTNPGLAASLSRALANLEEEIDAVEAQLGQLAKDECAGLYAALGSIPGIGPKTALMLLTLTQGFRRFETSAQLACYVGLAPSHYQSGSSVRGGSHLIKMGAGRMRQLMYMAAIQAKKANPACRALYERLLAAGKAKLVALMAVAHKLLRQAFAVGKSGQEFDPNLA